jgi:hypothetical protein
LEKKQVNTPVLFLVFNRPDTTLKVFNSIRQVKPPRLYISSDGPRVGVEGEVDLVEIVRNIALNVDWDCEVKTLFRETNLGCKYSVSSAITWFFNNEERGIILEDDCLPSKSFFFYSEELLNKYENSDDVFIISGENSASDLYDFKGDYMFSKYANIWGWASWSNKWSKYNVEIEGWPSNREKIELMFSDKSVRRFWLNIFDLTYRKQLSTWDYQLCYLLFINSGKCIIPKVNMISNIGFGPNATHTISIDRNILTTPARELNFPINHSLNQIDDLIIDLYYERNYFRRSIGLKFFLYKIIKLIYNREK